MYQRSTPHLLRATLFIFLCLLAGAIAKGQTNTAKTVKINSNCGGYMEYLPAGYANNVSRKYPTIIYIHGGASYGSGSASNLANLAKVEGIPVYIGKGWFPSYIVTGTGDTARFIVISPQFAAAPTKPSDVKAVIDYVLANYRVDVNRLYLTGFSLGGNAVWQAPYNLANAQRLAAMVPVAGYNYNPYADTTAKFIAGANVPVWAIHSNADQSIPIQYTVNMVNKINSYNPTIPAILTRLTTQSHDSTVTAAYNPSYRPNGKNIYEWMLQYARVYPPVAVLGKDTSIVLPVNSVKLSASRSTDPQGGVLTYAWTKLSGPAQFSFSSPSAADPVVSGLIPGNYVFSVTITNTAGLSATGAVKVFVINPNGAVAPVARAGDDVVVVFPSNSVTLNGGTSSAPNGAIQSYQWSQLSGPSTTVLASASSASTLVSGLRPGLYQFVLTVVDNLDSVGKDTVTVRVSNPNKNMAPVASAGAAVKVTLPVSTVSLDGAGSSDADGWVMSYRWRQLSGPSQSVVATPAAAVTTVSGLAAGVYRFELAVTDDSAAVGRDTVTLYVNPAAKMIQVNVYGGSNPAGTGWNNWNVSSALTSSVFSYSDGTASTVKAALNGNNGVADNGASYAVTMCPQIVGRTATYYNATRVLTISGLDSTSIYGFEAYASRANTTVNNTYSAGGSSVTLGVSNNYTNKVSFASLTPVKGVITVTMTTAGAYNYLNGFTLTEYPSATSGKVNKAPVAVAGTDISINLPVREVMVNGNGSSDADGSVKGYWWTQVSGPSTAVIGTPSAVSTVISGLDSGVYVFQLTVTDNQGAVAVSQLRVTVGTEGYYNIPPVAVAGADVTMQLPADSVMLDGSASSDADGRVVSYAWTKVSGPGSFVLEDPAAARTLVRRLVAGTYAFELRVADNFGVIGKDTVLVVVKALPLIPPVALAGADQAIELPVDTVMLDGSASSDTDGRVVSYAWTKVSGPSSFVLEDTAAARTLVRRLVAGTYAFELRVTDNAGLVAKDTVLVAVKAAAPVEPVAVAGADSVLAASRSSLRLDGSDSYDRNSLGIEYSWSLVSGPSAVIFDNQTLARPVVSGLVAGDYVFALTVTNEAGLSAADSVAVTVLRNLLPVADAGSDTTVVLPVSAVRLSGARSFDTDGTIVSYRWAQLSGPVQLAADDGTAVSPQVRGFVAGVYVLTLTVTDDLGGVASDTMTLTVLPALNLAPVAAAGADMAVVLPVSSVVLNGGASRDTDGVIMTYTWRQISGPGVAMLSQADKVEATVSGLVAGVYSFELKVVDDSLAAALDTVVVTVASATRAMRVNLYGGSYPAGAGWNNWNVTSSLSSGLLAWSDGVRSTISAVLTGNDGVADNGTNYPTTMCPEEVGRTTSYYWNPRTMTLSGLDPNKRYDLEVYASRTSAWSNTFTVNNVNVVINPQKNYSNKVMFNTITPTDGKIVLSLFGNYNYLNGFMLTEKPAVSGSAAGMTAVTDSGLRYSLLQEDSSMMVKAYPNPFREEVKLEVNNERAGPVTVQIVDRGGRVVKTLGLAKGPGVMLVTLPMQELSMGVYYVQVQMAAWRKTVMVVKQAGKGH